MKLTAKENNDFNLNSDQLRMINKDIAAMCRLLSPYIAPILFGSKEIKHYISCPSVCEVEGKQFEFEIIFRRNDSDDKIICSKCKHIKHSDI